MNTAMVGTNGAKVLLGMKCLLSLVFVLRCSRSKHKEFESK